MILVEICSSVGVLSVVSSDIHERKEGVEVQQDDKQYEGGQQGDVVIGDNQNDLIKRRNLFD